MRNPVRRLLRGVHALAERLRYRYDIFISYARSDGSAYAEGLKRSLAELDFTCFLDRHDLPAGEGLTRALHEAIRRSARQVIVGTPRATDPERKYIALEVEEFHASGRKAIPIDIGGALAAVEWDALRGDDLVWIDESVEALQRGIPSLSVVESIRTAFEIKKRNAVLRLEIAFVFSLFIAGAAVAFTVNWRTTESLMEQRAQNDAQILQLDAAKLQNELQERNLAGATRASVAAADEAKKQRELAVRSIALAEERLVDMTAEQGRLELLRGRPLHALLYLRDAKARGRDDEALQFMTHVAMQALTPVLWGHDGEVTEMAWSPSGTSLLTADRTNVRLWDASGRLRTFLCDHGKPVHADLARYIAGRNEIITAGDKITFWSSEGEWLRELPLRGEGRALTPDERYLLVGGGETMQLLELATGSLRDLPASGNAFLDAKQERAAIISEDGLRIRLYDLASGTLDRELEEKGVKFGAVSWSPDGRYLVALHDLEHEQLPDPDGGATLWNVSSGKLVNHLIGHRGEITAAAFSPDGAYLASGDYRGMVFLWKGSDFETPEIDTFPEVRAKYLPGHGEMIRGLAFSDDSRRLVTRASEEPARVWDVRTQKLLAVLAGSEEKDILDARFSPNAIKVATRSNDGTVRIWHASTDLRSRVVEERFGAVAVSADRRRFAFVHKGDVRVFDENGRTVAAFSVPLATTSVLDLSADGSKLAVLAEEGAAVIDVATRKVMHPPVEHPYCTSVSVTSNGRYLLTMGGTVAAVWDLEKRTSKVLQAEVPHIAMRAVLSPDGKLVAVGGDREDDFSNEEEEGATSIFDMSSRRLCESAGQYPLFSPDGRVLALIDVVHGRTTLRDARTCRQIGLSQPHVGKIAFSADGRRYLIAGADALRIVDVATGLQLSSLGSASAGSIDAKFSPEGGRILTVTKGGALRLWDARGGQPLLDFRSHDPRLTVDWATFLAGGRSILSVAGLHDVGEPTEVVLSDASLEKRKLAEIDRLISRWMPATVFTSVVRQQDAQPFEANQWAERLAEMQSHVRFRIGDTIEK